MGPSLSNSQTSLKLTELTLVDEDTSSILIDNANKAKLSNVAIGQPIQVAPSGGKVWN